MPRRIAQAQQPAAPNEAADAPSPRPMAHQRRTRRMTDVLEGARPHARLRIAAPEALPAASRLVADPIGGVHRRLAPLLAQFSRDPAAATREAQRLCREVGFDHVLPALLSPQGVCLLVKLLPHVTPGTYGAATLSTLTRGARFLGLGPISSAPVFGVWDYGDGTYLSGTFYNARIVGPAVLFHAKGSVLSGMRFGDMWQGSVLETEPSGLMRQGLMRGGQFEGVITELGADGSLTRGTMYNGLLEGKVDIVYRDGSHFLTNAVAGVFDGPFLRRWPDGAEIRGLLRQGIGWGPAEQIGPAGQYIKGNLVAGFFTGVIERRYADGTLYLGDAKAGNPHGLGVRMHLSGRQEDGRFQNGLLHGTGRITYPSGDVISGLWHSGIVASFHAYTTADGLTLLNRVVGKTVISFEDKTANAKATRLDSRDRLVGERLLRDDDWSGMLSFHAKLAGRPLPRSEKEEVINPWRDWQPNISGIQALDGMLKHVLVARADEHATTRQFLRAMLILMGPAQQYSLFSKGETDYRVEIFGHWPNLGAFVAATMPTYTESFLGLQLHKADDVADQVTLLFHQENYKNPRAMLMQSLTQMVAGLMRAWQHDVETHNTQYRVSHDVLAHLLDNGPCLEGRTTSLTQRLQDLDLLEDVARLVPDLAGKDAFAQSSELLRVFRQMAFDAYVKAHKPDVVDTVALEADPIFLRDYFNATLFRAYLRHSAAFAHVDAENLDAIIAYQCDVIAVLSRD